eukprot:CAMPEP_0197860468 /NCGR_PEP_ID=MMETSP1438-20131217/35862_1 /TAXON_ID=1461541 /ORGANISM="Pterosperma sp., Strain CCMP1384" /LENGTH=253 /DNA_ID=CAMNT_0043477343 /DNA_START=508 /DNA_END=1266 /DNA_ORIENTATION=+
MPSKAKINSAADCQRLVEEICASTKGVRLISAEDVTIDESGELGSGSFCTVYPATVRRHDLEGAEVVARVINTDKCSEVLSECKVIVNICDVTVTTFGLSYSELAAGHRVVILLEKCAGNLDDFLEEEGTSVCAKARVCLRVLRGLQALKGRHLVWRDLKGQNMLVKRIIRNKSHGDVHDIEILLSDFGTAVYRPKSQKRRMTLYGPGTEGYIAPETRSPDYSHQVDMWAFLVWAAGLCLDAELAGGTGALEE